MHIDELKPLDIFDGLTDGQLDELVSSAREVAIVPGVDLFVEGDHADDWWVLLDGAIDLVRHVGREDTVVGHMDVPGRWAGGFRAWDDQGVYLATGRGMVAGRVMRLPATRLRELANAWFPFGGHLIRGLNQTARRIEDAARQRGALVTLGTLAAGLAHEINNPASAAVRAVGALETQCETLLSSLGRLAEEEISPVQFAALDALRRQIDPALATASQDPLDRADREDALTDWLSRHEIQRGWSIASVLAGAGVEADWCDQVAAVVEGPALQSGLEWVASTVSATALLAEMSESTKRISELVAAIKSYSQMDRASMQRTILKDGLESTLIMLGHKLRDGVTVVREYDDVPEIDAYAGELNQVWTNLIDNAVDAMAGGGTLRLAIRPDGDHVVVEVADTGSGMPPEVQERAFEAFYTTKDVGQGTGLGLDIARRIVVDRHNGEISIDSEPGRTVIAVRLPTVAGR